MSEIVRVPFHGDEVLVVEVDSKPHIVLKPALDQLGVAYSAQVSKLRGKSWATMSLVDTVGADGKSRQMTTVDVRTFLMLLATIDEGRVSDSARPKLIAYQSEVADAIESYWTRGGSINPRATEDQLSVIIGHAKAQAEVLGALAGIVDRAWLEAKARHVAARALGEEPEVDLANRPLTVGEYLQEQGVSGGALRSISTTFGKKLKALYRITYNAEPLTVERFVDNALRQVAGYTEAHRPLFEQVWSMYGSVDA